MSEIAEDRMMQIGILCLDPTLECAEILDLYPPASTRETEAQRDCRGKRLRRVCVGNLCGMKCLRLCKVRSRKGACFRGW